VHACIQRGRVCMRAFIGVSVHACIHRGECALVYMSVCIYNSVSQKFFFEEINPTYSWGLSFIHLLYP
jgi:hypothetical protein